MGLWAFAIAFRGAGGYGRRRPLRALEGLILAHPGPVLVEGIAGAGGGGAGSGLGI